jgi:hypothetical protein
VNDYLQPVFVRHNGVVFVDEVFKLNPRCFWPESKLVVNCIYKFVQSNFFERDILVRIAGKIDQASDNLIQVSDTVFHVVIVSIDK